MSVGYVNKARCTVNDNVDHSIAQRHYLELAFREVCYSDVHYLWIVRELDQRHLPYVQGGISETGRLFGGVVEYPVLSGILIWLGTLFVHTGDGFLVATALLLTPFGLAIAWWLGQLSRWRALLWALGPPLVLYSFHNWDLAAVACSVAAIFVMHGTTLPLPRRGVYAAVLLGLGFAFKIYPGLFVIPLGLYVLTAGGNAASKKRDLRGAMKVVGAATSTAFAVNLPFMLVGFDGWWASIQFQLNRQIDETTNSIWFWGLNPLMGPETLSSLASLSILLVVCSLALACWLGWLRYQRTGSYPWIQVCAAALCGFLLLHKVHSPQFALWLLPFFVLISVRWGWILAYLLADLTISISIFRWMYLTMSGASPGILESLAAQALVLGVWGRAALLIGLFVTFLSSESTVSPRGNTREGQGDPGRSTTVPRNESATPTPQE